MYREPRARWSRQRSYRAKAVGRHLGGECTQWLSSAMAGLLLPQHGLTMARARPHVGGIVSVASWGLAIGFHDSSRLS